MRKLLLLLLVASCFGQTTVAPKTTISGKTTLILGAPPPATTSLGQSCANFVGSGTSTNCTLTGVLSGSTILVGYLTSGSTISGVSDGVSYTATPSSVSTNGAVSTGFYSRCNVSSGNYTVTASGTSGEIDIWVYEVKNASTSCPNTDVVALGSASSSSITTGSASLTHNGFAAVAGGAIAASVTVTGNAPWTAGTIQNGNGGQYQANVSSGTSVSGNMTMGGSSAFAASLATVKAP